MASIPRCLAVFLPPRKREYILTIDGLCRIFLRLKYYSSIILVNYSIEFDATVTVVLKIVVFFNNLLYASING